MKLFHTADWHLGQNFYNYDRHEEHEQALAWLVVKIADEQPDALLITGDIFDTANPSSAAQRQFYQFIRQAKAVCSGLQILVIAGNHDSPGRVEAPRPLLEAFGVTVVGSVRRNAEGQIDPVSLVQPLNDKRGEPAGWCLAVPFLRPGDVPRIIQNDSGNDSCQPSYHAGVEALYRQALDVAMQARGERDLPIIAMGHCHLSGGSISELSERRLVIGGSEALSASLFGSEISYVALGHLHKPQQVSKPHIRYSGSLMPMSFAEVHYPHQVVKVETHGSEVVDIQALAVPRSAQLLRIPEQPALLDRVLTELETLELEARPTFQQPYLEVRVMLDAPEPGLRRRVEQALSGKPVRLARIDTHYRDRTSASEMPKVAQRQALEQLQPEAVFLNLFQQRYGEMPSTTLHSAFQEILTQAYHSEEDELPAPAAEQTQAQGA